MERPVALNLSNVNLLNNIYTQWYHQKGHFKPRIIIRIMELPNEVPVYFLFYLSVGHQVLGSTGVQATHWLTSAKTIDFIGMLNNDPQADREKTLLTLRYSSPS